MRSTLCVVIFAFILWEIASLNHRPFDAPLVVLGVVCWTISDVILLVIRRKWAARHSVKA